MIISNVERSEWAHHHITQEFLNSLRESRKETMEAWAREHFIGQDGHATMQANAKALGGVNVLVQVIEIIEQYMLENDK